MMVESSPLPYSHGLPGPPPPKAKALVKAIWRRAHDSRLLSVSETLSRPIRGAARFNDVPASESAIRPREQRRRLGSCVPREGGWTGLGEGVAAGCIQVEWYRIS